ANYELHVIDRINMQFNVEMSILPRASNLTKFRVTGHLPLLKANFSDRKYKIMMNIIEKVTPESKEENTSNFQFPSTENFSLGDLVEEALEDVQSRQDRRDRRDRQEKQDKLSEKKLNKNLVNKALAWDRAKRRDSMVMAEKLGLKTARDLVIDSSSEGEDESKDEDKHEEFFDAEDTDVYRISCF